MSDSIIDQETARAYDGLVRRLCTRVAELEQQLADARLEIVAGRAVRDEVEKRNVQMEAILKKIASKTEFPSPHNLAREFLAGPQK